MQDEMRVMMLNQCAPIETSPLKMATIDRHEITRPDEILIKIEACGVCHSQLHGIEGDWRDIGIPPVLPTVPGHEVVGTIVEVGDTVTKFKVGQRAGITPLLEACGKCQYCTTEDKEYLCESAIITGESTRGGYAEYITAPEKFATLVPDDMKPEYAAPLFCAGITAYKAVQAAEPYKEKKVGIFGIGGVGHMAIQFAKVAGCSVIAVSRTQKHLDVARKLGADQTVTFTDDDKFADSIKDKVGLLDAAIVFAPADAATDAAVTSVKKGGIIVIATVGKNPEFFAFEEKTIRGTLIGSTKDMEEVIKICSKENLTVISQTYPLEDANRVLRMLKESKIDARAVLIP